MGFLTAGCLAGSLSIPQIAFTKPRQAVVLVVPTQFGRFLDEGVLKHAEPGLARLATALDAQRDPFPALLVCLGDFGFPAFLERDGLGGDGLIGASQGLRVELEEDLMAELGIDAMTPGRGELAKGAPALLEMQKRHPSVHIVSVNVADTTGHLLFPSSVIIRRDGIRFGITGLSAPAPAMRGPQIDTLAMSPEEQRSVQVMTSQMNRRYIPADLEVLEPTPQVLARAVSDLSGKCDVIVALLDMSRDMADTLLKQVPGVDVAVVRYGWPAPTVRAGRTLLVRPEDGTSRFTKVTVGVSPAPKQMNTTTIRILVDAAENVSIARRIGAWNTLGNQQGRLSDKWGNVSGRHELESRSSFGLLDSVATSSAGEIRVFARWPREGPGMLVWRCPLDSPARPLYADMRSPPAILPLQIVRNGRAQELPVQSAAETNAMRLLRFLALSQEFAAARESLAAIIQVREAKRLPWSDWERTLLAIYDAVDGQRQDVTPGNPSYWRRRSIVYHEVVMDSLGKLDHIEMRENNSWPGEADSVESVLAAMDWSRLTAVPGEPRARSMLVATAMDRRESSFDQGLRVLQKRWQAAGTRPREERLPDDAMEWNGERLPTNIPRALNAKRWTGWLDIWRRADPAFSPEDFITTGADTIDELPGRGVHVPPGHVAFLRDGPDSWALDPLPTAETTSWSLVDKASRVVRDLWTDREATVLDGDWVDGSTFVLVGWSGVSHPRFSDGTWGNLQVPTVWVGEANTGVVRRFQGALTPKINLPAVRQEMATLHARTFRGVK